MTFEGTGVVAFDCWRKIVGRWYCDGSSGSCGCCERGIDIRMNRFWSRTSDLGSPERPCDRIVPRHTPKSDIGPQIPLNSGFGWQPSQGSASKIGTYSMHRSIQQSNWFQRMLVFRNINDTTSTTDHLYNFTASATISEEHSC
ncbi:hypothetical protein PBRA_003284 [Plasmodiophora brassicae]|uniref:Uncharacterized protein n=1 Tax=Plasmodiophora brassicae TaxID=37360 RepID=A0A0G4J858_PLABS|nr:hypothetical protein PBRA_003284 [Plasmodiophora brassicae]